MGKAFVNIRSKKEVQPLTQEQWRKACEHARTGSHKNPPIIEDTKQIVSKPESKEQK